MSSPNRRKMDGGGSVPLRKKSVGVGKGKFYNTKSPKRARADILTPDYLKGLSGLEAVPWPKSKRNSNSWGRGLLRKTSIKSSGKKPRTPRTAIRDRVKERKETTLHVNVSTIEQLFESGQLDKTYKNELDCCLENDLTRLQLKRLIATGDAHKGRIYAFAQNPGWSAEVYQQDRDGGCTKYWKNCCFSFGWRSWATSDFLAQHSEQNYYEDQTSNNDTDDSDGSSSSYDSESESESDDDDDNIRQRYNIVETNRNGEWSLAKRLRESTPVPSRPGDQEHEDDSRKGYNAVETSENGEWSLAKRLRDTTPVPPRRTPIALEKPAMAPSSRRSITPSLRHERSPAQSPPKNVEDDTDKSLGGSEKNEAPLGERERAIRARPPPVRVPPKPMSQQRRRPSRGNLPSSNRNERTSSTSPAKNDGAGEGCTTSSANLRSPGRYEQKIDSNGIPPAPSLNSRSKPNKPRRRTNSSRNRSSSPGFDSSTSKTTEVFDL